MIRNRNQNIRKDRNCIRYITFPETDFKEWVRNFFGMILHNFIRNKINYWPAVLRFRKFFKCNQIINTRQNKSAQMMSIVSDTLLYL